GAGYAGLTLLAGFQPDLIKLDMALVRGIDTDPVRQAIVAGVQHTARALGCTLLAEGVETDAEFRTLRAQGVALYQGYLFGRPALEALEQVDASLWERLAAAPEPA
ncbi:MAG TPA: EAL domain-containing protein, partial [Luteimonas sp.]|nr:EAL domain-containing protein [Luteimonas sp.]